MTGSYHVQISCTFTCKLLCLHCHLVDTFGTMRLMRLYTNSRLATTGGKWKRITHDCRIRLHTKSSFMVCSHTKQYILMKTIRKSLCSLAKAIRFRWLSPDPGNGEKVLSSHSQSESVSGRSCEKVLRDLRHHPRIVDCLIKMAPSVGDIPTKCSFW